ncbi:MAG: TIGR04219 family outer membrane beta-barrel protein [Colwellia sp.]|nr:TIGR04219 family outer membrane beta-barrel protein [Colwellia sp.]
MKKEVLAAIFAALFTANVQANTVGLYLGGQIWQSEASGVFGGKNTLIDFNLKKEQQNNYFVAVEHPFPLFPNVRISSTTLDTTGKTNLTQEFSFGDETFLIDVDFDDDVNDDGTFIIDVDVDVDIDASFNVSYVDYTLYYELFDNGLFSFDLGVTARDFDGAVTVTGTTTTVTTTGVKDHPGHTPDHIGTVTTSTSNATGKIKTDEILPMLYVATNIRLPLTGLSVFVQGDFLLIGDHSLYDYQVGLSYELVVSRMVDLNLTLGYRVLKMEFEDLDNLYTDLEFKGAFAGVILHF